MYFDNAIVVPTKLALAGIVIGVLSGFTLAQFSPGPTIAAVVDKPPFTIGKALDTNLAKFNGDYFAIGTEPGISLVPNASTQIRKIGFGQTSFVTVETTSSGTYSSDGLASPNIRYPGIHVERMQLAALPFAGIYGWSKLTGWTKIPLFSANSIGFLDTDTVPASRDGVCVADTDVGGCR